MQEVAECAAGGNQRGGHQVDGHPGDAREVAWLVFDVGAGDRQSGENGTHAITESSAAVATAMSCSFACWPGRHSSHSARSWDPATVPHPVALWNRACGGQAGLNTWVEFRSARPVPMIVPIAAAEDQTANSHAPLALPGGPPRRKLAGGKTHKEALRSLKRQISHAIFARLQADAWRAASAARIEGPGGQPGSDSVASAAGSHPAHRLFGSATPEPSTTLRPATQDESTVVAKRDSKTTRKTS